MTTTTITLLGKDRRVVLPPQFAIKEELVLCGKTPFSP